MFTHEVAYHVVIAILSLLILKKKISLDEKRHHFGLKAFKITVKKIETQGSLKWGPILNHIQN